MIVAKRCRQTMKAERQEVQYLGVGPDVPYSLKVRSQYQR
jgi:hypothetical protein